MSDYEGNFVPAEGALRLETFAFNALSANAFSASLRWLIDEVGLPWVYERIARLGRLCHDRLSNIAGVTVLTPRDQMAGLLHFTVDGAPVDDIVKRLADGGILIRAIPEPAVLRASLGFYNTEEEIERLATSLRALAVAA
jgi:L-cysteine/cystine lyase